MTEGFKFELESEVAIYCSGERGTVIGRSDYTGMEDQYLIRYQAKDGRAVEAWWAESALEEGWTDWRKVENEKPE